MSLLFLISLTFWHINGNDSAKWRDSKASATQKFFRAVAIFVWSMWHELFHVWVNVTNAYLWQNKQSVRHSKPFYMESPCDFLFLISFGAVNKIAIQNALKNGLEATQENEQKSNVTKIKMNSNLIHRNGRITFSSLSSSVLWLSSRGKKRARECSQPDNEKWEFQFLLNRTREWFFWVWESQRMRKKGNLHFFYVSGILGLEIEIW